MYQVDNQGNITPNIFEELNTYQVLGKIEGITYEIAKVQAFTWEGAEEIVERCYNNCWVSGKIVHEEPLDPHDEE